MFVRKDKDGNWYVCRRTTKFHKRGRATKSSKTELSKSFRNWFLIKWNGRIINGKSSNCGLLEILRITIPKKFIGKKVRLKLEIIPER